MNQQMLPAPLLSCRHTQGCGGCRHVVSARGWRRRPREAVDAQQPQKLQGGHWTRFSSLASFLWLLKYCFLCYSEWKLKGFQGLIRLSLQSALPPTLSLSPSCLLCSLLCLKKCQPSIPPGLCSLCSLCLPQVMCGSGLLLDLCSDATYWQGLLCPP